MISPMNMAILTGFSLAVGAGILLVTPFAVYASSDVENALVFEHVMTIDIHEQSTVVYSSTDTPVVCEVEYAKTENGFSEPLIVVHDSNPHKGHIVKIPDLIPNTEYEYRFTTQLDDQKIYSEQKSFVTID